MFVKLEPNNFIDCKCIAAVGIGGGVTEPRPHQRELFNNCTYIWTTQNGVEGGLFTGYNGNSIFLPATGGMSGSYWTSSLDTSNSNYASIIYFATWGINDFATDSRFSGLYIRPVLAQ